MSAGRGVTARGSFGRAVLPVSAAFLLTGIMWPQAAEALLRVYLATLAVGFVVSRAYGVLPSRTAQDAYSPFAGNRAGRTPPSAPRVLRKLTADLAPADDARQAPRAAVPWPGRRTLIDEAAARLAERHGLNLGDPADHAGIRRLVSGTTWQLITPRDPGFVPVSRLDLVLDDLEKL